MNPTTTERETDEADNDSLPHEDYMAAVADALTAQGIEPTTWWTETPDGQQLDAYFQLPTDSGAPAEHWPHGVGLGWDQYTGWTLIERGGGQNVYPLSSEAGIYGQPLQVATDAWNRLFHGIDGWMAGPICMTQRYDTERIIQAVKAWETRATCPECGSDDLSSAPSDRDVARVTCADCGHQWKEEA